MDNQLDNRDVSGFEEEPFHPHRTDLTEPQTLDDSSTEGNGSTSGNVIDKDVPGKKPRLFRSSDSSDLLLLKIIQDISPWTENTREQWAKVKNLWGPEADVRSVQNLFNFLIKKFRAGEQFSRGKSGTNEEYCEKEKLLTAIVVEIESVKSLRNGKKSCKNNKEAEKAIKIRDPLYEEYKKKHTTGSSSSSVSSSRSSSPISSPLSQSKGTGGGSKKTKSKKQLVQDGLDFQRMRMDAEVKKEELRVKLEQDKLQLERERFEE